jgi:uncharacterized protein
MVGNLPAVINPLDVGVLGSATVDLTGRPTLPVTKYSFDFIDFGATGEKEIYQNVRFALITAYRSVVLDRDFGMEFTMIDKPIPIAKLMLQQEIAVKITLYEPRCFFESIEFTENQVNGWLKPDVSIVITTNEEQPSLYEVSPEDAIAIGYAEPYVAPIREQEWGPIVGIGQVGPIGPVGPQGEDGIPAWTINIANFEVPEVGERVDVIVGEASWMTIGEWVWIAGAGPDGTAAALKIVDIDIESNVITLENCLTVSVIEGPPGPMGPMGPTGAQGPAGSKWYNGIGSPGNIAAAKSGDYYLDTSTGDVYILS